MRNPLLAMSSALLLAFAAAGAFADAVTDSIAELKSCVKKNDGAKAVELMTKLAESPEPAVTKALIELTECERIDIACTAYRLAAPRKDTAFLAKLKSRMGNKKLAADSPVVYQSVIEALAAYGDKSSLDVLEDAMPRHLATNAEFSTRIVRACAAVRDNRAIDTLLKWMQDSASGTGYVTSSTTYPSIGKEARANYVKANEEVVKQLGLLTGKSFPELKSWKEWWKSAESTFKFPEPPKK